ncbi:Crp/Fnr family transcriptional regulator [Aliifodinibius salicampi]|uniref:Crp/Fnr family transcriptional regulator n=1 Tax=Fodinibius salicampi TaxID=1920655 RepID=A0ABT3PX93_9BACT|nr:Crp/Fnr family transcriptional regulator [Fodinibius salicampi]MCW9712438.1 Crp/Fnr family transcriptional regulator [Fodinibius salicampi]
MSNTENISLFLRTNCPLSHKGLNELLSSFKQRVIPQNTIILKETETDRKLRFLNKGVIREYYLNDHREVNINFYTKPRFITDFSSFINTVKTKRNQQSLTDIELLELDRIPFFKLLEKYECREEFRDLVFEQLLKIREMFEYNRVTKTPEELYKELRIYKPEWLQEIPQYHIASYLGITPETLSRIRRRIS